MATIGSMAVKLTLSAKGFVGGVDKAAKSVANFAAGAAKAAAGAAVGLGVSLLGLGIGFGALIKKSFDAIRAINRLADQLGVTTQSIVALQTAAKGLGLDQSVAADALTELTRSMADVDAGSVSTAAALGQIGLSAKDLSGLTVDQQFRKVSDAFKNTNDSGAKAAAAFGLFGAKAGAVMPLLQSGSKTMDEAAKRADALGLSFTRIDGSKVDLAAAAMSQMGDVIEGVGRQLAVQLAPWITAVAQKFNEASAAGLDVGKMVSIGFRFAAKAVAKIMDVFATLKIAYKLAVLGAQGLVRGIGRSIEYLLSVAGKLPDKLGGAMFRGAEADVKQFNESMRQQMNATRHEIQDLAVAPSNSSQVDAFFDDLDARAKAAANNLTKVKTAGGALPKIFKFQEQFKRGKSLMEEMASPVEKFQNRIKELGLLLRLHAIDWKTYGRAAQKAVEEIEKASDIGNLSQASAVQANTGEGLSAINAYESRQRHEQQRENPQQRLERVMNEAKMIQRQQLIIQQGIAGFLQGARPREVKL